MTDEDRDLLIGNFVDHLRGTQKRIQIRQTAVFEKAHPEYGSRVAAWILQSFMAGMIGSTITANSWPVRPEVNAPLSPK